MATTPADREHVLLVGNLTALQLERVREAIAAALAPELVQAVSFPSSSSSGSASGFLPKHDAARPVMVALDKGLDGLCRQLHQGPKDAAKLEKAMTAIHEYQKQQQRVISDFGLLSSKYQNAKATLQSVMWQRLPQLEEFGAIPSLDAGMEESDARVGTYALGKLLGAGHFANVREILEREDEGTSLVLKAIDKTHVKNLQSLLRVAHEIEALRRLRHPNIIRLYDVLHGTRCVYLVTERLNTDLYEIIGEHPEGASGDLAQRIIMPILSAVIHIHAHGFLHRDLKPENILCSRSDGAVDLVVKLCDFGLTCHLPPPGTLLNDFCGSPGFICPEMIVEKRYNGVLADFFSVGCVLLELLLPAESFAKVWMQTFNDDVMADGLQFKHRLRGACAEAETILRGKLATSHEELLALTVGLLKVDAFQRHSTTEARLFLQAVGAPCPQVEVETKAAESVSAALEGLALEDQPDNMTAGAQRNNNHNAPKQAASRRSPVPMAGSRRAISPVPSPSREMALAAATAPVSPRGNNNNNNSSSSSSSSSKDTDGVAAPRPAGLVISSPKGFKAHAPGVRSTLRAQVLQRERDKDVGLRPDSPGTPLGVSPGPSEVLLEGLSTPEVGTPLGSPTAGAAATGAGRMSEHED